MKRLIIIFSFFAVCATASGFVFNQLLSEEDLKFQQFDNENGTALGSDPNSEHPWGSYNEWQCFDLANVDLYCADYDYGSLVPALRVEVENEIFLFDSHVEDKLSCEQTLLFWQNLTAGGQEICVFAANMPDVDLGLDHNKPQSLWYVSRIKGASGYWDLRESLSMTEAD